MPPESSRGIECSNPASPVSLQQRIDARPVDRLPLDLERELDVLAEVAPGQQVRVLEDHPDVSLRPGPVDLPCRRGVMRPPVSACRPDIAQSSVVLPQPLGPRIVTSSPSRDVERDVVERVDGAGLRLRRPSSRPRRASSAPIRTIPSSSGLPYCMNSTTAPSTSTNATRKEVVAAAGGVERLGEDDVPLDRRPEVVDAVGDVRRGAERPGHGRCRARSATTRR